MSTDINVSTEGLDFGALNELLVLDPRQHFRDLRVKLSPKVRHAKIISRGCGGIASVDNRMSWASVLFTRMTVIGSSIHKLVPQDERRDHWDAASICALTRNLAECYLWMFFLSFDEITGEEHEARIYMMYAHDNRGRERIMEENRGSRSCRISQAGQDQNIKKLNDNAYFTTLPEKRRNEVIRGDKAPFIQDQLLDKMGIERSYFRTIYRSLSAQTHSSPVAFYDVITIGGGTGTAHEREMRYMGMALEFAIQLLDWAVEDMLSMHPYAEKRGRLISEKDVRKGKHLGFPIPD